MPTTPRKGQLPNKLCRSCGRPFEWRKKWRGCWDEVKYCSERCRRNRSAEASVPASPAP